MASREYSKRLGVISDEQLQAAAGRFGLGRLIAAEAAPGGLFGQNIFLETTAGQFVLRGNQHGNWQLAKERHISGRVHEAGCVPVPWPYEIDAGTDIFGWAYAITPRLPGTSGEAAFGGHHRAARDPAFAYATGVSLGRLHETPVDAAGKYELAEDGLVPLTMTHVQAVRADVDALVAASRAASSATTDSDCEWVDELFEPARPALSQPFRPTIIHLDYAPGNSVGVRDGDGWRVTGIVDWMTAEAGDPEADLARMLSLYLGAPETAGPFIEGYRSIQPEREGSRERFPAYMLLDRLLIWEYGQRNRVWFEAGVSMREWIEPFTRMMER